MGGAALRTWLGERLFLKEALGPYPKPQLSFCSGHNTDWNVIKWARFAQGASLTESTAVIIPLAFLFVFPLKEKIRASGLSNLPKATQPVNRAGMQTQTLPRCSQLPQSTVSP